MVLNQTKLSKVLSYIKSQASPHNIYLASHSGQGRPTKNNLGAGILSHIENHEVYLHIEITHFDWKILQNSERTLHKIN